MSVKRTFDFAHQALQKYKKDVAFATKVNGEWEKTSTLQYITEANKISRGLLKLGINPGDKIGLISHNNRTEWPIMDIGMSQIGIVSVPVYPTISEEDYIYIFNNAEIKYCFVSNKELFEKVNSIKSQVPSIKGIFTFDDIKGAPNWKEILDLGEDDTTQSEVEELSNAIQSQDVVTLIYTSGTTGRPKGVQLTHENIVDNVLNSSPILSGVKLDPMETKTLSFLPLCHVFERMLLYFYQHHGYSIYFAESIDKVGDNIKEVKPHLMTVVPRVVEKVYDKIYNTGVNAGGIKSKIFLWAMSVVENYQLGQNLGLKGWIADKLVFKKWREGLGGNIVALVSGSAPLSVRLNRIFNAAGITILEGYGLTETSPVISVNSFTQLKFGTVGHPLANAHVKIAEDGEILVKGTSVFAGYYKDEEKTKEVFTEDGYFKTGDIGIIDSEGFLTITDRKKEMFKTSGGKYIAPQVIENHAKASKFIEQIMVIGDGEKMPAAFIQPDFAFLTAWAERKGFSIGSSLEEMCNNETVIARISQEIENLNRHLGKWEQIKKFKLTPEVWSIEDGLLTPTLKLKRKNIKAKFINLYNEIYERN
ncbi:long-chain fatty acid--CoA ligase [Elizabethkingia sp. JS20170427COW]|uniref:AMP-dependent synthetase/ligase n=1 Tax=Elizabethkingia sp. JS20170427COW TaxID=2583851 RepID=UPI001110C83B|nr:long-chain fatty acid--CoA ligase [Elizabethkingia sp. JS20170427COW]QCX54196.1 long-chain fatty acid--CoA ligase [Elizabethkingia sp. JS20170427COW]